MACAEDAAQHGGFAKQTVWRRTCRPAQPRQYRQSKTPQPQRHRTPRLEFEFLIQLKRRVHACMLHRHFIPLLVGARASRDQTIRMNAIGSRWECGAAYVGAACTDVLFDAAEEMCWVATADVRVKHTQTRMQTHRPFHSRSRPLSTKPAAMMHAVD